MKTKEELNEYMKAYMQRRRDTMSLEKWRKERDRDNATRRIKYRQRTPEQIEKYREYQRNKQKLYYFLKKQGK